MNASQATTTTATTIERRASRSHSRRRARELVVQGLYQRQLSGNSPESIREQLLESAGYRRADAAFFETLWSGTSAGFDALVALCVPELDRPLARLSPIERAILAIGAFELSQCPQTPRGVAINEAIELAKAFGGTDGHKYVNGVLDRVAARVRPPEITQSGSGEPSPPESGPTGTAN